MSDWGPVSLKFMRYTRTCGGVNGCNDHRCSEGSWACGDTIRQRHPVLRTVNPSAWAYARRCPIV
jgi:hypothetical protein